MLYKVDSQGGFYMYANWMDKINIDVTEEDIKQYEEDKKKE